MSKLHQKLIERVNKKDILDWAEGVNGLLAVTESVVYLLRGKLLDRKSFKTYTIKSISSIQTKKPNLLTRGHFQIIASGVGDRTKRYSTAFDYAQDENTVMISDNFDHFLRLEQLIYKLQNSPAPAPSHQQQSAQHVSTQPSDDVFTKIEKLSELRNKQLITDEEYEAKRKELLAQI
ncbi:SHOCT domain-containing protein [Paenibacillus tuaregi]|uniref:SHOCT domain-containing protein n=1 Tax=Paenibacillus tuaregi TaxID=1816681 RepID=UPI000838FCF0|nr:SHOCT domain-containing protein [Paenibacillus tuaregi]